MRAPARRSQRGFTFLGLLFAVALLGMALGTIGVVWSTQIRREREAELLFVGGQYREAIQRYHAQGGMFPRSLQDLVEDKRVPMSRRFLRRLYADPMTGQADWQLQITPDGGIAGIASASLRKPIKVAGFTAADKGFADAECYCDWKFVYTPRASGRLGRPIISQ